jgi:hypothetical protein
MQTTIILFILTILSWTMLPLTPQIWAAPGFDLDLKELKKPSSPPTASKKKPVVVTKKKQIAPTTQQSAVATKAKPALKSQTASVVTAALLIPAELALKGGNACQLAERMATAVARSVPVEKLLFGLNLKPVAAVRYAHLDLLITCGIPAAEAYTFGRLLKEHHVELLNIQENETIRQVARGVLHALALSYQLETDLSAQGGELVYSFPAEEERQRPLRLILHP